MSEVDLSVLVLSWNTREMTLACLRALASDRKGRSREVIVVDNGSADGSAEAIAREFPDVTLIANPDNRYYSGGNNQAADAASGRYFCLLNSDTEVRPGALDLLVDWLESHPDYAMAAAKLISPDGTVQTSCNRMLRWIDPLIDSTSLGRLPPARWWSDRQRMHDFDHLTSCDVEQPATSAAMVRASDFRAIGGFDRELKVFFTDVELCRRLAAREKKLRYVAEAEVLHHLGGSARVAINRNVLWQRDRIVFYRKFYGTLGDTWIRSVIRLQEVELIARITLGPRKLEAKRRAIHDVRTESREILAS
jgi:hypothetical protein